MTLDKSLRICSEVFGISPSEVYKRVAFSNAYYGADHPKGTRIVFVNGKFLKFWLTISYSNSFGILIYNKNVLDYLLV